MDANKVEKLREIGYEIRSACDNCVWGNFRVGSDFGRCHRHHYNHQKHTDETMDLSIHRGGHCPDYSVAGYVPLGPWMEFLEGGSQT